MLAFDVVRRPCSDSDMLRRLINCIIIIQNNWASLSTIKHLSAIHILLHFSFLGISFPHSKVHLGILHTGWNGTGPGWSGSSTGEKWDEPETTVLYSNWNRNCQVGLPTKWNWNLDIKSYRKQLLNNTELLQSALASNDYVGTSTSLDDAFFFFSLTSFD